MSQYSLTPEEMETLTYLPCATFYIVAVADGKLQYPESNAFGIMLKKVTNDPGLQGTLVATIFTIVERDLATIMNRLDQRFGSGLTYDQLFAQGRAVLDRKVEAHQAKLFKEALIIVAERVASIYPVFARGPSAEEARVIEMLKSSLGLKGPGDAFVPFSS